MEHSRTFFILIDHFSLPVPAPYSAKICAHKDEPAYNENCRACTLIVMKMAMGCIKLRHKTIKSSIFPKMSGVTLSAHGAPAIPGVVILRCEDYTTPGPE